MGKTENLKKIVANLWRPTLAHIVAVAFMGYAITAGVIILERGMGSISTAVGFSPIFLAALLALAVASLPIGLLLRYLCGKVPLRPLVCIISMGGIFGLCLVPFMHPELTDGRIAVEKYRAELFLIHGIAGLLGGALWWLFEFRILKRVAG